MRLDPYFDRTAIGDAAMEQNSEGTRDSPRVVTLKSLRMPPETGASPRPVGIVAEGEQKLPRVTSVAPGDITFPPNTRCPSTAVTSHGGAIGTADPVQLIFWGAVWQTSLSQLRQQFTGAVQSILAGPYMSALRQYGVKRCSFGGSLIILSPPPPFVPSTFTDETARGVVQSLIDQGTFPEPDEPGGRNLYFIIMPPNTQYQQPPGQPPATGAHSALQSGSIIDPDYAWVAWVGNQALNGMTATFSHELVEMCTDPEPFTGWYITGAAPPCSEIGDICNTTSPLNNVTVVSYWSIFDNTCVIATAWSLKRTLAGAGIKLSGKGLLSIQKSIPSLNQWIVNL
jgi:hypothetical protein